MLLELAKAYTCGVLWGHPRMTHIIRVERRGSHQIDSHFWIASACATRNNVVDIANLEHANQRDGLSTCAGSSVLALMRP